MYAVIETGGKQHKVEKGMILSIDLLKDDVGKKITFDNVLLYVDGDNVEVGQPYLNNVKVTAEVKDVVKADKISILRFRRRKHSMRKIGHRAKHSQVEIKNIKLELKDFLISLGVQNLRLCRLEKFSAASFNSASR